MVIQHCPKIGASYQELGEYSASELRVWQNKYLQGQVAREEHAVKHRDVAYDYEGRVLPPQIMVHEPEACYGSPQPLNPLFAIIDEAVKRNLTEERRAEILSR